MCAQNERTVVGGRAGVTGDEGEPRSEVGEIGVEERATAMQSETCKLEIQFAGMCLFARKSGISRLDVLMPSTMGHLPRLFVPAAYHAGSARHVEPLNRVALDHLAGFTSPHYDGDPLHEDILDLTALLGWKVDPASLSGPTSGNPLLARVTLGGGRLESINPGIRWKLDGMNPRRMAISCVWILEGVPTALPFPLPTKPDFELREHEGRIRIQIFNAPRDEKPDSGDVAKIPRPDLPVHHFARFYDLLTGGTQRPVPHEPEQKGRTAAAAARSAKGIKFTCIGAQAEVG